MNIEVVALEEQDIGETIRVMKEAWEHAYQTWEVGHYPIEAHEFDLSMNAPEHYMKTIEYEHGFFFVAKVNGKIAGSIRGEIYGKSGFAMIRNIAVHQDYLRNGAGRALMEHALEYLEAKGCHKVSLHTQAILIPAVNLYLKLGFVPEAYMAKQWWGIDFIFMSKWIPGARD